MSLSSACHILLEMLWNFVMHLYSICGIQILLLDFYKTSCFNIHCNEVTPSRGGTFNMHVGL